MLHIIFNLKVALYLGGFYFYECWSFQEIFKKEKRKYFKISKDILIFEMES